MLYSLLRCLAVNDLPKLTDHGYNAIGYSDNILHLKRGPHLDVLFGVLQPALEVVNTLCGQTGLSVIPGKMVIIVFTRRYRWKTIGSPKLREQRLTITENAKYLGFILNKELAWKERLESKCKKHKVALAMQ